MRKIKLTKEFIQLLKKYGYKQKTQLTSEQTTQLCGHTNYDVTFNMYKDLIKK